MKRLELLFDRPAGLEARSPAEYRGMDRDSVRLMVSDRSGHVHARFSELPQFLEPGDLVVVNRSATLPASLPASGKVGPFLLNLSNRYGERLWLAEPRWSAKEPGPLPFASGETARAAGLDFRFLSPYPALPRLWFVHFEGDVPAAMARHGQPIRYGYADEGYPLSAYQTIFSSVPGSAEMPSAGRPFTPRLLQEMQGKGVETADIVLHTGVSSLEVETDEVEAHPLTPEAFRVPEETALAVNRAKREGRRVIAVGTTVARALESAWDGRETRPMSGFTRLYIHPGRGVFVIDGLISGLHDPVTSHLAMLYAIAGQDRIRSAYREAVREEYLWHEFGDSHLILAS
jgi:S-adenosylmethionine:tRNA ribosyltransferase-isomerase